MNESNYTPIDPEKIHKEPKKNKLNFYLLLVATVTAALFAVLLFILIQKKQGEKMTPSTLPTPTMGATKEPESPSPTTMLASPSPTQIILPTQIPATPSADEEEATSSPDLSPAQEGELPAGTESTEQP